MARGGSARADVVVGHHAPIQCAEFLEGNDEWCMCPVELDQTSLRGPLVTVPQARVQAHGLAVGIRHANVLLVLEHANGLVVDCEHDLLLVPQNAVIVEIGTGVEP